MRNQFAKIIGLAVLAALLTPATAQAATDMIHTPQLAATANQDLEITIALNGASSNIRVRVYYRTKGKELFKSLELTGQASRMLALIPGSDLSGEGLEYYIEAATTSGGSKTVVASSPLSNPAVAPHSVVVRRDDDAPLLTPLSPGDGEVLETGQPVITVAWEDRDSGVNLDSVLIKIDGDAVPDKGNVQVYETLVTYVPEAVLSEGDHELHVIVKDKAGNVATAKWSFKVSAKYSQSQIERKARVRWDGSFDASTAYGMVAKQPKASPASLPYRPYGENKATLNVNGRTDSSKYRLRAFKSDQERSDGQPIDRYLATVETRDALWAFGDYAGLRFSELSLSGLSLFRGVTLDLRSGNLDEGHTRLIGAWGMTRRGVPAHADGYGSFTDPGVFQQYLTGFRWEAGGPWFLFGLNQVTVNDDKDSNPNSVNMPLHSYVGTADVSIGIKPAGLKFYFEGGVDTWSGVYITDMSAGTAYRAGMDWNYFPSGTQLKFEWRDLGWGKLPLPMVDALPSGFATAANPGLQLDYRGFESNFSQSIKGGLANFDVSFNRWHDNLAGGRPYTTVTQYVDVSLGLRPMGYPSLNVGYSLNASLNDSVVSATARDSGTLRVSTSLVRMLGEQKSLNNTLSYSMLSSLEKGAYKGSQDISNHNVVLASVLNWALSQYTLTLGYNTGSSPAVAGLLLPSSSASGLSAGLRWGQTWKPNYFDSYLGFDFNNNQTDSAALAPSPAGMSQNVRSTVSLGCNLKPAQGHNLGAAVNYALVSSSIKSTSTSFVAVSDDLAMLQLNASYRWDF